MGIHDRDYYRREGPSFLETLADQGRVTNWLIGINVICFIIQMMTRNTERVSFFTEALVLDVNAVLHGQVWRLLTHAFLHSEQQIMHILFNMMALFFFGRMVEDRLGSREFLWYYLVAAVIGGLAYVAACQLNLHGTGRHSALGASGAVSGVAVLAAIYNPRQIVYIFFILPAPIWAFLVFFIAIDALDLLGVGKTRHNVATSAHLGGVAFGFLYHRFHWRLSGWTYRVGGWLKARRKPRLKLYREDEEATPTPSPRGAIPAPSPRLLEDEQLEAQVDAILAKIPQVGMEGLTESERQILVRASEAIKRRRG